MALRHRDIVPTIVDRENVNARATKAQLTKQPILTRRPALDELSNKINAAKPVLRKAEAVKETKIAKATQPSNQISTKENDPPQAYSSSQIAIVIDHDAESSNDPQMVSEYLGDIFQYLREVETKYPIEEDFLVGHSSSSRMRAILVNWLVQVHTNFSLCLETLHLCVSIVDRYLQKNTEVGKECLQLVGATGLLIACKYEEMYLPELSDFVFVCDNAFTKRQILKMEMSILMSLDCNLGKPLSIHFLRRFSKLAKVRLEQHNLAKYILELALLDHNVSPIRPSMQAAAACCLSIAILSNVSSPSKIWTLNLAQQTNCKYSDFKHVVVKFAVMVLNADNSKHQSIPSKYADSKYGKISTNSKLRGTVLKKIAEGSPKV